ncbi:MAG: hypothetical protein PHR35_10045 [Kiritimatiellae bacterium]|nr:hypothetical protein [Kiritimatiellia bacterium]
MTEFPYKFINRVRREGRRKAGQITLAAAAGHANSFVAYDWGSDTFVFERDVWKTRPRRAPVLIVPKHQLAPGTEGYVLTVSSGNHSVAAMPLLRGDFWHLGRVPKRLRGEVLTHGIVCCNIVGTTLEISQRDVPTRMVVQADEWLRGLGWPLASVVVADRVDATLDYYRRLGQEWRIKPLAWTREEMDLALRASRARIHSRLTYYHSVKGVHLLSYAEFSRLVEWAQSDYPALLVAMEELAGAVGETRDAPVRTPKFHGHHEIEFFGVRGTQSLETLVPELERLYADILHDACDQAACIERLRQLQAAFLRVLEQPELADERSDVFVGSMYKHLTGEVYFGSPDQVMPAFDDRKTALPGATYRGGKAEIQPGADARTRAILDYVPQLLSHGESLEYINVYELRLDAPTPLGRGPTREIVFKTNRRPVCLRLIEKRLAHHGTGYANYMLARVQAFQNLGVAYGDHHLLARHDRLAGEVHYFIRQRYPGYAFGTIARSRLQNTEELQGVADDPEAILIVAALMGNAAAQNLAVKKYIPENDSVQFGEGKEVIEFGYDVQRMREMPLRVRLCSVRGTLGWPHLEWTEKNLNRCFDFYMHAFARTMSAFHGEYASAVTLAEVADRFLDGFAASTRELHWNYTCRKEQFDLFDPDVRPVFGFKTKWQFALWALGRQHQQLSDLRQRFKRALDEQAIGPAPSAGAGHGAP